MTPHAQGRREHEQDLVGSRVVKDARVDEDARGPARPGGAFRRIGRLRGTPQRRLSEEAKIGFSVLAVSAYVAHTSRMH